MSGRRSWIAIVLFAAFLHVNGIARSTLPAQDGLKFIRVARSFQVLPWSDAVRGSDQHPLYPALVAVVEPIFALFAGHGPDSWRIAAQTVSALAAIALLFPLRGLTRDLFGPKVANIAALGFVLLPLPMAVGHDTLSDSLALLAFVSSLRLGLAALRSTRWNSAVGCGLAAGIGFLARPEVLVAPFAVILTGIVRAIASRQTPLSLKLPNLAALGIACLTVVGSYALVKGEVSEKLAMRSSASIGPSARPRKVALWLPPGLDDPRWDFSPKEEPPAPTQRGPAEVAWTLVLQWSESLGGILAFFALWGLARDRHIRRIVAEDGERPDPDNLGRWLVGIFLALFVLVLVRHELKMGYLSGRHTLGLVTLSIPWAAAGVYVCARGVALKTKMGPKTALVGKVALLAAFLVVSLTAQLKPAHAARWGHREAGKWLVDHAEPGEAVLDTRGWAAFASGLPSYDYWHVRQAFTDSHLAYIVVEDNELTAPSRRAATLRAVLGYAASPVAQFPDKQGGHKIGVRVFRYERPITWEGLRP